MAYLWLEWRHPSNRTSLFGMPFEARVMRSRAVGSCLAVILLVVFIRTTDAFAPPPEKTGVPDNWIKMESSGTWCGAKGLWLLCRGFGMSHDLEHIKHLCDPSHTSGGLVSLAELERAASELGLAAQPVKCGMDWLKKQRLPALTVHRFERPNGEGGISAFHHCLVLLGYEDGQFFGIDPFLPAYEVRLDDHQFAEFWTGEALLIARHADGLPVRARWFSAIVFCLALDIAVLGPILWYRLRSRAALPVSTKTPK